MPATFPFYIGLLLLLASGTDAGQHAAEMENQRRGVRDASALACVISVLVPDGHLRRGISFLGIYLSSALLIGYFMRRHGSFGWPFSIASP